MGVQFTTSQAGTLTGIWFYSASGAASLPQTIALYQVSGHVLVASQTPTWSALAGTGWVRAAFSSPPSLTASTSYKACVFNDQANNWYSLTTHYWNTGGPGASGITSGPLFAPNTSGADGGQDTFTNTPTLAYPDTSFNDSNYWVDPEVTTAGGSTVNGAAALAASPALTAPAVLSRLGHAPLAASPALTAAAVLTRLGHAALAANPALTAPAVLTRLGHAPLAAAPSLSAQGTRAVPGHAALAAGAALTAQAVGPSAAALAGVPRLVVAGTVNPSAVRVALAAFPSLAVSAQASVNPELLWERYMLAAGTARAAEFSWRMQRSAGGASGQTGFLFQAFYEADAAAGQAYETWRAAYRSVNPGARG
jgi:hypothetical protein